MARNSLTDLLAQKAALDRKIAEMQRASRSEAVARVKALMAEYGLTAADIGPAGGQARAQSGAGDKQAGPASPPARARRTGGNAGKKVAPKYRDPATGSTWSGRGLKPKWLAAALASGRSLSEFNI